MGRNVGYVGTQDLGERDPGLRLLGCQSHIDLGFGGMGLEGLGSVFCMCLCHHQVSGGGGQLLWEACTGPHPHRCQVPDLC